MKYVPCVAKLWQIQCITIAAVLEFAPPDLVGVAQAVEALGGRRSLHVWLVWCG
jgi:hypothetical protein